MIKGLEDAALPEALKLDFIQVISAVHMRVVDGVGTQLQMQGMVAKLAACAKASARVPGAGGAAAGGGRGGY